MNKKSSYKKSLIALVVCGVLLISALIGGISAKYTQKTAKEGTGADITLQQVENETDFYLLENNVDQESDGDYNAVKEGDNAYTDQGVTYYLIPGTILPKTAEVTVKNKTNLPAYLYLEIGGLESVDDDLAYSIINKWAPLDASATGTTGTYVYTNGGTDAVKLAGQTETKVKVFESDRLNVDSLKKLSEKENLTILCYLVQIMDEDMSAKEVFDDRVANGGLIDTTAKLINQFIVGEVEATIAETFDGNTKSNVTVKNNGNVPALMRAKVVVNWVETVTVDGETQYNVIANPAGHTASISYNTTNWQLLSDGYYYYKGYVAAGASTEALITEAKATAGTTYQLQVEVLAEAIQATGFTDDLVKAVKDAWGRSYNANNNSWN